jgi:uncharacterized protein (TIGR03067 family)
MWKHLVMVAASGLLMAADTAAPVRAQDAVKQEMKKLQGTWKMESYHIGDAEASEDAVKMRRLVIEGDKWTSHIGEAEFQMTWKVDPSKSPKHLDLTTTTMGKEEVRPCIYQVTEDTLVVCLPLANTGARPSKFEQTDDVAIAVYKRQK